MKISMRRKTLYKVLEKKKIIIYHSPIVIVTDNISKFFKNYIFTDSKKLKKQRYIYCAK